MYITYIYCTIHIFITLNIFETGSPIAPANLHLPSAFLPCKIHISVDVSIIVVH